MVTVAALLFYINRRKAAIALIGIHTITDDPFRTDGKTMVLNLEIQRAMVIFHQQGAVTNALRR